jgi:hypothetical protein
LTNRLLPDRHWLAWVVGIAGVCEWHLIWAAASGMETILFIALALALIDRVFARAHGWTIGVWGGLLILTRPEGLLLVGLAMLVVLFRLQRGGWLEVATLGLAGLIVLAPGLWLNLHNGATLFPNTFYAKQQEYAALMSSASIWLTSVLNMTLAPFAGPQVLLIPGLIVWGVTHRKLLLDREQWVSWLPLAWIASHWLVYALRLPVSYQHGRYLIPIILILLLYGIAGTAQLLDGLRARGGALARSSWLIRSVVAGSIGVILIAFIPIGAAAYALDVSIIDDEMVAVAKWIAANTPPQALVAAHDIGAIGYFSRRPLLDLAGLISPEVIPYIRDESRLLAFIQSQGAAYFVTFPNWYPVLSQASTFTEVFSGHATASPEHLVVYSIR